MTSPRNSNQTFAMLPSPPAAILSAWCDLVASMHTALQGMANEGPPAPALDRAQAREQAEQAQALCLWLLGLYAQVSRLEAELAEARPPPPPKAGPTGLH